MKRAADLCTGLRVALAPVLAWQLGLPRERGALVALLVFTLAAATDYVDGSLARAAGTASRRGRLFDHGADALLLFPSFWVLVAVGRLPAALPIAAMTAFALYVLDGWRRGDGSLGAIELTDSRSGAIGGVLNYVVVGAAVVAGVLDAVAIDRGIYLAAFGTAAVNGAAALERLLARITILRGSRAARKEVPAPRS